jgi:hypothetical protein
LALVKKKSSAESFNFYWCFLADRLPTKDNLFRRGILNVDTQLCSLRCGSFESLSDFFLPFWRSHKVWCGVRSWLGVKCALYNDVWTHVLQFSSLHVRFLKIKDCFKAIWVTTIWTIWKARNYCVFNQKVSKADFVIHSIKLLVWWWFKTKCKNFDCNFKIRYTH